jgi:hypothetical protein
MGFEGAREIGVWVLVAIAILPAVKTVIDWARGTPKRDIGPQPIQVQEALRYAPAQHEHPQYMLREDCREAHKLESKRITAEFESVQRQIDHLGNKLDTTLTQHNVEAEARAGKLHGRIDVLVERVGTLSGTMSNHIQEGFARGN